MSGRTVVLAAALLGAAPAPAGAARRPALSDLADFVLKSGKDWAQKEPMASRLGYDRPRSGKKVSYDAGSDGLERVCVVTLDAKGAAGDLIFMVGRSSSADSATRVMESLSLRVDLEGRLLSAVSVSGAKGAAAIVAKDPRDPEVRRRLAEELRVHRARAAPRAKAP